MNTIKQAHTRPLSKLAVSGFVLGTGVISSTIIAITGYRLGWWRHPEAFSIIEWATYVAVAALIISIVAVFKIRTQSQQRGLLLGIAGIFLTLPVIAATLQFEYSASTYPRINDITTDTQDPPSFWDVPNPIEYPGQSVADIQLEAYPDIKPLQLTIPAPQVFEKALELVINKGWEVITSDADEGRIEAVDTSLLFGFKDEVVVRITDSDAGAIIDIRSRSRIGRIDRGANVKRIRNYLDALKSTMASLSMTASETVD